MGTISEQQGAVNPNISFDGSVNNRYANPFFDLAQQYMPPTIKELFKWCTFYYYNSPLIGSTITKISRYPITDIIIEDENEQTRQLWLTFLNDHLAIKEKLMEVNLDYHVYGNAFVSLFFPFNRFLTCNNCKKSTLISQADWDFKGGSFKFYLKCKCGHDGPATIKDVPYKDKKNIRVTRWNPENIQIKYNEYTGKAVYLYSVPSRLKDAINSGDKDIVCDLPEVIIDAARETKMIKLNNDNFYHLKRPTLAEQDQGWGKPLIIHVLKDMYYFYTLRRAQEAIALEHIVPFDIIYPMPNAQQDPYVHSNLSGWKTQIEGMIKKHRRDPNFKGVIPIPVGFGRLGGDGKAMMLGPELTYLTQTIVGGMGIPQEFLFGGLNWTGSSVSLRTLENDFIQNRGQLLRMLTWMTNKIRLYLNWPPIKKLRMADFRMADDVQRNQQIIGLNAQQKLSNHTLLTELGFDYEKETKKVMEEIYIENYINEIRAKGSAKMQGESNLIGYNYQKRLQDMQAKDGTLPQLDEKGNPINQQVGSTPQGVQQQGGGTQQDQMNEDGLQPADGQNPEEAQVSDQQIAMWTSKLITMPKEKAVNIIQQISANNQTAGMKLQSSYSNRMDAAGATGKTGVPAGQPSSGNKKADANMTPLPEKGAPTRAGAV